MSCKHEISHTNYFNSLYCDWYCEKEHYTSYAFCEVIFMMLMTFKEDGFPKNLETKSGRTMTRIQMSSTITARGWENIFREFVFSSTKRCLPWLKSTTEKLWKETDILQSVYIWIPSIWYFATKRCFPMVWKHFRKKLLRKRWIFGSLYIFESSQSDIWLSSIFPNKQIMWRKTSPSCALLWENEVNDEVFSIIHILAIKMHWRYIIFYSFCTSTWKITGTLKVPLSSQNQHHREPQISHWGFLWFKLNYIPNHKIK